MRGRVLGEDERDRRVARLAHRLDPRAALREHLELAPRDAEAHRLEHERHAEHAVAPEARAVLAVTGVHDVLDAVVDRERAADREEHQRDDERPEVLLARAAEGKAIVGGARREAHADEEEALVAGVGDAVHGLGERRRRARHERRAELARRDRHVAGERCDDDLPGVGGALI